MGACYVIKGVRDLNAAHRRATARRRHDYTIHDRLRSERSNSKAQISREAR